MPRSTRQDIDLERGKRLRKTLEKVFPGAQMQEIWSKYAVPRSTFDSWLAGRGIDNSFLRELGLVGADLNYLLTGVSSAKTVSDACHRNKLCERLPTLFATLADGLIEAFEDPAKHDQVAEEFLAMLEASRARREPPEKTG